jgi:DNA-binding MarR family transcriptional regulator
VPAAATAPPSSAELPDEAVVSTWRAIAASHAAANVALERELARLGLGVSEFEVLDRLSESREHKFRAQELADAVHLSQSALSRLIDRLVKNGLVERCSCGEDRRGIYVLLTEAGLRRHAEAAPVHREVLARVIHPALIQCQCTDAVQA